MTEKVYNESIDIWGVGLILGELLAKANNDDELEHSDKANHLVLFKGGSCFPISPAEGTDNCTVHSDDQIYKILARYPNINMKYDFSFVNSKETMSYLDQILKRK